MLDKNQLKLIRERIVELRKDIKTTKKNKDFTKEEVRKLTLLSQHRIDEAKYLRDIL